MNVTLTGSLAAVTRPVSALFHSDCERVVERLPVSPNAVWIVNTLMSISQVIRILFVPWPGPNLPFCMVSTTYKNPGTANVIRSRTLSDWIWVERIIVTERLNRIS